MKLPCYRSAAGAARDPVVRAHAGVVELVDTRGLGPRGASLGGSSPSARTIHVLANDLASDWPGDGPPMINELGAAALDPGEIRTRLTA